MSDATIGGCKIANFIDKFWGIEAPWWVERVELKPDEGEVHVYLEHRPTANW